MELGGLTGIHRPEKGLSHSPKNPSANEVKLARKARSLITRQFVVCQSLASSNRSQTTPSKVMEAHGGLALASFIVNPKVR